eukprot:c32366_g1_i1.p1 GENE.c32366_g1_i1~~c32366_g1_i1.p1  ORF type:complete len:247 (+),score=50.47 c32366_g1_i1:89-742(+)
MAAEPENPFRKDDDSDDAPATAAPAAAAADDDAPIPSEESEAARKARKEEKRKKKVAEAQIIVAKPPSSAYGHFHSTAVAPLPAAPTASKYQVVEYVQPEEYRFYDVIVDDPMKVGDGVGAFTLFHVRLKSTDPEFAPLVDIRLRYSDFFNLRQQLVEAHPTMLVPNLPGKQTFGRFASDFVEKRAKGLQKFLSLVVSHAVFGKSAHVTEMFRLVRP